MSSPVVSIVICTRNRASQLPGTLDSIAALESAHEWEALIVDNASTDNTRAVIEARVASDPRFRYLHVARIGLGAGRDAAWRATEGQIVSFSDDDCYLRPDYVDQIVKAFEQNPAAGVIGGRILLHDPTDAHVTIDERTEPRFYPAQTAVHGGALHGANLSFRRQALEQSGGFDPELGAGTPFPCEDVDAIAAVLWAGWSGAYQPGPTVSHHHGRKEKDLPRLTASYDAGRGAYRTKYLLRPDTRAAYWRDLWMTLGTRRRLGSLVRLRREARSAFTYLSHKKRPGAMVLATLLLAPAFACAGFSVIGARLAPRGRPVAAEI